MYPYTAGGTGLDITVPELGVGRRQASRARSGCSDPAVRERLKRELAAGSQPGWSNLVARLGRLGARRARQCVQPELRRAITARASRRSASALGRDPADVAWDIVLEAQPNRRDGAVLHDERGGHRDRAAPALDEHRQRRRRRGASSARWTRSACRIRAPTAISRGSSPNMCAAGRADAGRGGAQDDVAGRRSAWACPIAA